MTQVQMTDDNFTLGGVMIWFYEEKIQTNRWFSVEDKRRCILGDLSTWL